MCIGIFRGFSSPQIVDDAASLATVSAIVDFGVFSIDHIPWQNEHVGIGAIGKDGHLYSKYGIGLIAASAPLYLLGRLIPSAPLVIWQEAYIITQSTTGARLALMTNAILSMFMIICFSYLLPTEKRRQNMIVLFVLAFSTPIFTATRGYGSEIGTALCIVPALVLAKKGRLASALWFICAAALFRPVTLVLVSGWLVLLWRRPWREWVKCALVVAIGIAILAYYNYLRFGSALSSGYTGESVFKFQLDGLVGFLFSPGRSIFLFMPIVLLLIPAVRAAIREKNRFTIAMLISIGVFFMVHTQWREWHGGYSYGPRLLIPIIPIIIFIVSPWLSKPYALPLILIGLVLQWMTLTTDPISVLSIAIRNNSTTFDRSVWSLDANSIVLQLRTLLMGYGPIWGIITLTAAAGMTWLHTRTWHQTT